jgi:hypothetical protein
MKGFTKVFYNQNDQSRVHKEPILTDNMGGVKRWCHKHYCNQHALVFNFPLDIGGKVSKERNKKVLPKAKILSGLEI